MFFDLKTRTDRFESSGKGRDLWLSNVIVREELPRDDPRHDSGLIPEDQFPNTSTRKVIRDMGADCAATPYRNHLASEPRHFGISVARNYDLGPVLPHETPADIGGLHPVDDDLFNFLSDFLQPGIGVKFIETQSQAANQPRLDVPSRQMKHALGAPSDAAHRCPRVRQTADLLPGYTERQTAGQ